MSWETAVYSIAGVGIHAQNDSGWVSTPEYAINTPLGMNGSIIVHVGSPSKTRTISGYVLSEGGVTALALAASAGALVTFSNDQGSASVYLTSVSANRIYAANLDFVSMVTVKMIDATAPVAL